MSENNVSEAADNTSDGAAPAVTSDDVNNGDVVQPNAAEAQQASNESGSSLAGRNDQQQLPYQPAAGIHHSMSV